jgi:hypothetical protein
MVCRESLQRSHHPDETPRGAPPFSRFTPRHHRPTLPASLLADALPLHVSQQMLSDRFANYTGTAFPVCLYGWLRDPAKQNTTGRSGSQP